MMRNRNNQAGRSPEPGMFWIPAFAKVAAFYVVINGFNSTAGMQNAGSEPVNHLLTESHVFSNHA